MMNGFASSITILLSLLATGKRVESACGNTSEGNPCKNGGGCVDGGNNYTCACLAGFTGRNCEFSCPYGWTMWSDCCSLSVYGSKFYYWEDAKALCKERGGVIAKIYDREKNKYVSVDANVTDECDTPPKFIDGEWRIEDWGCKLIHQFVCERALIET